MKFVKFTHFSIYWCLFSVLFSLHFSYRYKIGLKDLSESVFRANLSFFKKENMSFSFVLVGAIFPVIWVCLHKEACHEENKIFTLIYLGDKPGLLTCWLTPFATWSTTEGVVSCPLSFGSLLEQLPPSPPFGFGMLKSNWGTFVTRSLIKHGPVGQQVYLGGSSSKCPVDRRTNYRTWPLKNFAWRNAQDNLGARFSL